LFAHGAWIVMLGSIILFNKFILKTLNFPYVR
jgi:hypothetical protein